MPPTTRRSWSTSPTDEGRAATDPDPSEQRTVAEGFGSDAEQYERARPTYPDALIDRIAANAPGRDLLDIGCGTGISSRPFLQRDFRVTGVEPDDRMAGLARRDGVRAETARIEDWEAAGRRFDVAVAGQSWHWVDPVAGARSVAAVLRPAGLFVAFWNAMQLPSAIAEGLAQAYERIAPDAPFLGFLRTRRSAAELYVSGFDRVEDTLARTGAFEAPERWRFDWQRDYTRAEWLDVLPTFSGHHQLDPATLERLLTAAAKVVDAHGGGFRMTYATVATSSRRTPA